MSKGGGKAGCMGVGRDRGERRAVGGGHSGRGKPYRQTQQNELLYFVPQWMGKVVGAERREQKF